MINSPNIKSSLISIGACLLCGAVGSLIYVLYFNKDEETEKAEESVKKCELLVPEVAVGHIYGRHGAGLKSVEMRTGTEITFRDTSKEGHRICVITGLGNGIKTAQQIIQNVIANLPDIKIEEIYISTISCKLLLNKNSHAFQQISKSTGAKLSFSFDSDDDFEVVQGGGMTRIILKGTPEQIAAAQNLIDDQVDEAVELQKKIETSIAKLSMKGKPSKLQSNNSDDSEEYDEQTAQEELLLQGNGDKSQMVYVSAVATAAHFWVQTVGPRSVDLDNLISAMTDFYNDPDNYEAYEISQVQNCDLVAAKFSEDNKWYRGQVCTSQEKFPPEGMTNIYYLDFGLTEVTPLQEVCELRTDFLRLNFQAIECLLADVDYESATSDESTSEFELLCHSGEWKPVQLRVTGYHQFNHKTLPLVKLLDVNGPEIIDIGEKLLALNLVKRRSSQSLELSS